MSNGVRSMGLQGSPDMTDTHSTDLTCHTQYSQMTPASSVPDYMAGGYQVTQGSALPDYGTISNTEVLF